MPAAFRTGCVSLAFPETAANGETFAAFFAGERAASRTVRSPTTTPAKILGRLILNAGIAPKYSGLRKRRMKHKIHIMAIPVKTPIGIAKRHQFSASLRTYRITCFGVAPIQRIRPKNSVRCATLLLRLLAIIMMPANRTNTNNTAAATYTCIIKEFTLCPSKPSSFVFSKTCSSDKLNAVFKSDILFCTFFVLAN